MLADMERCITEMESCYQLLLPTVSEFSPRVETQLSGTTPAAACAASPGDSCATRGSSLASPPDEESSSATKCPPCASAVQNTASLSDGAHSQAVDDRDTSDDVASDCAGITARAVRRSRVMSGSSTGDMVRCSLSLATVVCTIRGSGLSSFEYREQIGLFMLLSVLCVFTAVS